MPDKKKIMVVNSDDALLDALKSALIEEGFEVVVVKILNLKKMSLNNIEKFIKMHDPVTILWDIPYPYENNWRFFKKISRLKVMQEISLIPTTTGGEEIKRKFSRDTELLTIINKPFKIAQLTDTIRAGVRLGKLSD